MTYAMTLDHSWEIMSEDEMHDVNGGNWYLDNSQVRSLVAGVFVSGASLAVNIAAIKSSMYFILLGVSVKAPILIGITGLLALNASAFAFALGNAYIDRKGVRIRIGFPTGLRFDVE